MANNNSPSGFKAFYNRHMVLSNIILVCIVAVFLCFFTLFFIDLWTNHGRTTEVPEIRNKPFDEAISTLKEHNLKYEIADSVYDSKNAPGTVKEIWPHPGTNVKPGRVIFLTINSFEPQRITITMPLTGVSSRQAITYLESLNIHNIRIVYVPSNFPDLVEGARYKGKSIVPGMKIPVNADVVLEVGTVSRPSSVPDELINSGFDTDTDDDINISSPAKSATESNDAKNEYHNSEPVGADNPDVFN